jgi:hypothetical protein
MQNRCVRNRKRSKRRAIYCPIHGCYLDSVSQKYPLFASKPEHLKQRGLSHKNALLLMANRAVVSLEGEWLEAFWCRDCQATTWYHVRKLDLSQYEVLPASEGLWQQATGVISVDGNPSVGEFTRKQARSIRFRGVKDFGQI